MNRQRKGTRLSAPHAPVTNRFDAAAVDCCHSINPDYLKMVYFADLRPCHPLRRCGQILDDGDPACPDRKGPVRRLDRLPAIVRGVACIRRRSVEEAAPFNRPFFQKLYRIHDTADLLDNMALVSYENRLFERRAFYSDLPSNHGATGSCLTVRGSYKRGR